MERIRERLSLVRSELKVSACRLAMGDATVFSRGERMVILLAGLIISMIFIAAMSPSFAGGDIVEQGGTMASKYYKSLFVILPTVAAVCLLIAIFWAIIVPTTQAARPAIQWGVRIFLGLIAAFSIGGLIALVKSLTASQQFTAP